MNSTTAEILEDWSTWQRAQNLSERTIHERSITITALSRVTGTPPAEIDTLNVMRFLGRPDLSPASRATYYASIRAWCRWLQAMQMRPDDPTAPIPAPRRPKAEPRPITTAELCTMLATTHRLRTRAYIRLGAYQGLRVHEIAKVRGEDIDVHGGSMTVTGKGGKTALLPLHDEVWELARDMPRTGWWFPSPSRPEHHVDGRAVGKAISDAMRRAGIASGKAHRLRHYFGTELVRSGVNLRIVQTLMRHESPATTAIYTRVTLEEERAGLAALAA